MFVLIFALSLLAHQATAQSDWKWPDEDDVRNDYFDWNFTKLELSSTDGNVIVAPYSLKLLLSLVQQGAKENSQTYKELSTLLPNVKEDTALYFYWHTTLYSLKQKSKYYKLNIASKIYFNESIHIKSEYKKTAESNYLSPSDTLNFDDTKKATEHINFWVSKETNGHIKELVTEGDVQDIVAILLNAIYFQGTWEIPFDKELTREDKFFTSSDKALNAKFMFKADGSYSYTKSKTLDLQMIRLPYVGNKFAMYVILPNKQNGLEKVIENITPELIEKLKNSMAEEDITLIFPKFKFDYERQLKGDLEKLNIKTMFSSSANLEVMSDTPLQISRVKQKAGIIVDEDGTTAYASTYAGLTLKINDAIFFKADHPFMFFIQDETTGELIFAGKCTEPRF